MGVVGMAMRRPISGAGTAWPPARGGWGDRDDTAGEQQGPNHRRWEHTGKLAHS